MGMAVGVDNAIISVIISAAVSFGIFGLKEKWIEPRRWRRSAEAAKLERKLEVYSTLTTVLQSFYHKGQRINIHKETQDISKPGEHALYHNIYQARRGVGSQVALVDLREMQSTSEMEFGLLNKKYKELMGFPV